jgi:hypothetical protein
MGDAATGGPRGSATTTSSSVRRHRSTCAPWGRGWACSWWADCLPTRGRRAPGLISVRVERNAGVVLIYSGGRTAGEARLAAQAVRLSADVCAVVAGRRAYGALSLEPLEVFSANDHRRGENSYLRGNPECFKARSACRWQP